MGKSRKDYEKFLNSISPDRDDEAWIIGEKNRYCGRENYGTMIKRYDPIGFNVGYREWAELRFRGDAGCITWRKVTVDEIIEHFKRR